MLYNYFKTAWRNLVRNKSFGLINILGLTIGITSCLLIFLVIQFETSFDDYHPKKDRTYRVVTYFNRSDVPDYTSGISVPVPAALRMDLPQLEKVAAISGEDDSQFSVTVNKTVTKVK